MGTRHWVWVVTAIVGLSVCSGSVRAKAFRLTVAGEGMEFVAQPERGYVVKVPERSGGLYSLAGLPALDTENARRIGGRDRRGVWTVENDGPAGRNEERIRALRAGGHAAYVAPLFSSNGETVAIIPEIVVRMKPGIEMEEVERLSKATGCTIRKRMEFTEREYLLEVLGPDAEAVFAAAEELGRAAEVEWACPNTAFRPKLPTPVLPADGGALPAASPAAGTLRIASAGEEAERTGVFPNDEYFPMQWHLYNTGQFGATIGTDIRAPEAWEITAGDPDIVVAVVDSGVESTHPDLINNLTAGYDFFDGDDQPDPAIGHEYNGHGTFCAGFIAAQGNNGIGVTGVTWNCKIMPIRMSTVSAEGAWHLITEADIATAFRWSASNGADILSNSWGLANTRPILYSAIMDITKEAGIGRDGKGCVVLFASGNNGSPITTYPQKYSEVIVVGATDNNDVRWSYSNYGPELDITAPSGERWYYKPAQGRWSSESNMLWTTDLTGPEGMSSHPKNPYPDILDYVPIGGTSSACPIAAGAAALILSIEPNLTSAEVRHFLQRSAKDLGDPGRDDYYGWGRVDARAALDMVLAYRCDLNQDWRVDEQDLAILNAAIDANDLSADIAPAKKRDGVVDAKDLDLLTQYLGTVLPELGLVGRWKFDEIEGVVAHDSEGKASATVIGGALWQPEGGKVGGALELSGVFNFAMTGFVLNPSQGPFSAFAWVKGGAPGQVVLSQAGGANWLCAQAGTGMLMTMVPKSLVSTAVITDGDWHRVGLSWDGTNRILYVDDVEVARDTQAALTPSTGALYIGAGSTMTPTSFWKGLIDDVRIYDRAVKP